VRVSIDGDVTLAFPATLEDATPASDVRGVGAALYALLVDRWPLPESGTPSGLRPADKDPAGEPVEPRITNPAIPFQISAAAIRAVQPGGGISTAPTLLHLLQQATADAQHYRAQRESERRGPPQGGPRRGGDDGILDALLLLRASGAWVELVTDDRNLALRAHHEGFIALPARRATLRLTRLVELAHSQLAAAQGQGQQVGWRAELYRQQQVQNAEELRAPS
jgi:hypothetical protein